MYNLEEKKLKVLLNGCNPPFRIAFISDTHIEGRMESFDYIKRAYDVIDKSNITTVIHLGDLFNSNFNTHDSKCEMERKRIICDQWIERAIQYYPYIPSIKTFMIKGNHDRMYDIKGDEGCMVEQLCHGRDDLIDITAKKSLDLKYPNFHSDIYQWTDSKLLFKHGEIGDIIFTPGGNEILISVIGHYHRYQYEDHTNCRYIRLSDHEYRINVPALQPEHGLDEPDFVMMELMDDSFEISPIYLIDQHIDHSFKKKIIIKT